MIETVIIIALIAYLAYKEYLNNKVVLDLTMKIKAKNLEEYAEIRQNLETKTVEVPTISAKDWDEAGPEEYLKALQKETDIDKEHNEERVKEE